MPSLGVADTTKRIDYEKWRGRLSSVSDDGLIPPDYIAGGDDFLYLPKDRTWKRRGGTTIQFDTLPASSGTGLLPAMWGGKCRDMHEFTSPWFTDDVPSLIALVTKETLTDTSNVDDGRFGQLYVRDQVADVNYTLGSEFSTATYPTPGSEQTYKVLPEWYASGDGGQTRGPTEFSRRFFHSGARRIEKVGNWWYGPNFHGTPNRWNGNKGSVAQTLSSSDEYDSSWGLVGDNAAVAVRTNDGDTTLVQGATSGIGALIRCEVGIDLPSSPAVSGWTLKIVARMSGSGTIPSDSVGVYKNRTYSMGAFSGGTLVKDLGTNWLRDQVQGNSSYATYTYTFTDAECLSLSSATKISVEMLSNGFTGSGTACENVTHIYVSVPSGSETGASIANRLIPSGPLPPCHAGTLATGSAATGAGGQNTKRPDSTISNSHFDSWNSASPSDLHSFVNDNTDSTYINNEGGTAATGEVGIADFGFNPANTDVVTVYWRAFRQISGTTGVDLTVTLKAAGTEIVSREYELGENPPGFVTYSYTLTSGEIAAVTAADNNWDDVSILFTVSGPDGGEYVYISDIWIYHDGTGGDGGGWRGKDRFYWAVGPVFEDGSPWKPTTPRAPNATLPDGLNLFTVDPANPETVYTKLTYSNLPVLPYGCNKKRIYRTTKIDSTTEDALQLDPTDLRLVAEIDNLTTTYDDYFADDDSLTPNVENLIYRNDYRMPPPARYIFAGANRVGHSYGKENPLAFVMCPITSGTSQTDYDRNLADDNSTLYGTTTFYYKIATTDAASATLTLVRDTGSATTTTAYTLANYTIEALVDAINATTASNSTGSKWRAQMVPDVNGDAAATYLCPTIRSITSCVVSGQAITKAAGGLSAIPVGSYLSGTGVTAGAYVSEIVSDTELTFVGTVTSGTKTLGFASPFGDTITGGSSAYEGYCRVLGSSLPGMVYFRKAYLDQFPTEKQSVWLTVASPGSFQSAPNVFSQVLGKHVPPRNAGISMGGAAVDNGFVVPFSKKNCAIRNERDSGTGLDSDYHLYVLNESRGCCAWNSVSAGNRFATLFTPEGLVACNLNDEMDLTPDIYKRTGLTVRGDFDYEAPKCEIAAALDNDGAYLTVRVLRQAIWVTYRDSGSHPDRQLCYDFNDGQTSNGLRALKRDDGSLFGWSTELSRSMTVMCEGQRDDGPHLYGWSDANAGSTGDGRIDEFEVGDTDNGSAIVGSVVLPAVTGTHGKVAGQKVILWTRNPSGASSSLKFHRGPTDDSYTLTPTAASGLNRDAIELPITGARVACHTCYLEWTQASGGASELVRLRFYVKDLDAYD